MSLCKIPTSDPKNPAYIDGQAVSLVFAADPRVPAGGKGVFVYERGVGAMRYVTDKLTTTEVVKLLEAASEPTEREAILIAGLREIANERHELPPHPSAGFARGILRDAGVAAAEPEQGGSDER